MKRTISVIIALLMIVLAVTSCGSSPSAAGKYYVRSIGGVSISDYINAELEGIEGFTVEDFLNAVGISSVEEYMTIELRSDGTAVVTAGGDEPSNGTWTQSGDRVTVIIDGSTAEFTLRGNEISFEDEDGEAFVLAKK